jgi:hypothetical protein
MNWWQRLWHRHMWWTIYEDGPRIVQHCLDPNCGAYRSTCYDMEGGTTWFKGNLWKK